jgi:squalene synthase HpnC
VQTSESPAAAVPDNPLVAVDHYENFPVASVLCPPRIRPAVAAIYHFARCADDIADEGDASAEQRLADLKAYGEDLSAVFRGSGASARWGGIFGALAEARHQHDLPLQPLMDLLEAFGRDVYSPRYETREDLLGYCRLSANPVGRLLLHLYGLNDAYAKHQSDCVCSALQLINFWQDCSVDLPRSRVYLPEADARKHGLDLSAPATLKDSASSQALLAELCNWARGLMLQGAGLALTLPGRAGWELRLVVQGGLRILDRIAALQFRTLRQRPTLGLIDAGPLAWRALRMRRDAVLMP